MRETEIGGPGGAWSSTAWSTVLRAKGPDSADRRAALGRLCSRYWKPVYLHIRGKGKNVEEAKDLAQEFFAYLLEKEILSKKDESASFRAFLRGVLQRFLSDQHDRDRALKRGGGALRVPMDFAEAEAHFTEEDPEGVFDRSYVSETLARVWERFREECRAGERTKWIEAMCLRFPHESEPASYAEIARRLSVSEEAVTNLLHRGKRRLRELLEEEVRQTVASPEDLESELARFGRIF